MIRMLLRLSLYVAALCLTLLLFALLLGRILPSNGQIAYMTVGGRTPQIWVTDVTHSISLAIADHVFTGPLMFPSPDGQQIAFFREENGKAELHIINTDGTQLRRLENVTQDLAVAWLPNNREIMLSSTFGTLNRYDVWNLTSTPMPRRDIVGCGRPVLSPDGQRMVTGLTESGGAFFCGVSGMSVINIDDNSGFAQFLPEETGLSAVWSPDSQRLAMYGPGGLFVSNTNGVNDDNTASGASQIWQSALNSSLSAPVWSPSGAAMALSIGGVFDVYLVPILPEIGEPLNLTPLVSMELYPAWSPDGKHIAFVSTANGVTEIYTVDIETRVIQRVTRNSLSELNLVWLP